MRVSAFRPLLGVLLCLLLTLDAVGAAAAAVRGAGGGCDHGQAAEVSTAPVHRHAAYAGHGTPTAAPHAHGAAATHPAGHAMPGPHGATATAAHAAHSHDAHAPHGRSAAGEPPHHADTSVALDPGAADAPCECGDGDCACPAACSLVLASPACPLPGARAPGELRVGLQQRGRPAPPQPDTLRPPIG